MSQAMDREITLAAEAYLEQYGEPLVHNTYLKIANLALLGLLVAGGALYFRTVNTLVHRPPIVLRISDVGRAEAVDYRAVEYRPREVESRFYLTEWARLYFGRTHETAWKDYGNSLWFLSQPLQHQAVIDEQRTHAIVTFQQQTQEPYIDIEPKHVILDDLATAPYTALIEFDKVYRNPADQRELKRVQKAVSVTYTYSPNVADSERAVNPLGLTVSRIQEQ